MPFLPNRPRSDLALRGADPATVNWPFVDELFDYIQFLDSGPIATAPAPGTEVGIVGAGPAGMVAAYELLRAGFTPVVFEASERLGGRNWSQLFCDGGEPTNVIAEMGAMRVPPENKVFYRYADQFGMKAGAFPDPGKVPTRLYYENNVYDWAPGDGPPGPFLQIQQDWDTFITPLMTALDAAYSAGDMAAVAQAWQGLITQYKNTSFFEALVQGIPGWTTEDLNAFGALGMGSGGFGPLYGVCFLEMLRLLANQFESDQELLVGGIGALTEGLYNAAVTLPNGDSASLASIGAVVFGTPVTAIQKDASSGNPMIIADGQAREFPAVIVATTTRAMELMGLTLATSVSPEVKVAIRNLHLMESSKLFIRTATKFWLDGNGNPVPGIPQNIQTDELPRGVYCLDYPQTENGVVLISYTWGDDSAKLLALSPAERLAAFTEILSVISPEFAAQLVPVGGDAGILNVDWEAEPYYLGAFKLDSPGQEPEVQNAYFQFQSALGNGNPGVFLAGDSVSWAGGWTEGALHTGLNAACAAAVRAGGQVAASSPLTMNPGYQY